MCLELVHLGKIFDLKKSFALPNDLKIEKTTVLHILSEILLHISILVWNLKASQLFNILKALKSTQDFAK